MELCITPIYHSILYYRTMDPLKSLSGAERRVLYKMAVGSHGIWMSYRSLVIQCHMVEAIQLIISSCIKLAISICSGCDSVYKYYNHKHYFEFHWWLYGVLCVVITSQYFTACGNLLLYNMTLIKHNGNSV